MITRITMAALALRAAFVSVLAEAAPGPMGYMAPLAASTPEPASPTAATPAASVKKIGVGTWNGDSTALCNDVAKMGPHLYYNWGPATPGCGVGEFIPMIWGMKDIDKPVAPARVLLGFNEPDNARQANMTVSAAITAWPKVQSRAIGAGAKLCSPATASPTADSSTSWTGQFMTHARSRGYKVDCIAIHYYSTQSNAAAFASDLKSYLGRIHAKWRLPIYVTEWALADWNNPGRFSYAQQAAVFKAGSDMMATLPYVEGHMWFMMYGCGDGWCLNNELLDGTGAITPVGAAFKAALGAP